MRIMPRDVNGIIFPSDDGAESEPVPFKIGDEHDSRLVVALREGARTLTGGPYEVRSWNLRKAFNDVICAADPVTVEHLVFSDEDKIEGVLLTLPWGGYRPESIYTHAGTVHDNEAPARVKYLHRLTIKVLRRHGWRPGSGPVSRYMELRKQWEEAVHAAKARVWYPPDGWTPAGLDLGAAGGVQR